jgi:hypothetical protein
MQRTALLTVTSLAVQLAACGGQADMDAVAQNDRDSRATPPGESAGPAGSPATSPALAPTIEPPVAPPSEQEGRISRQRSASCVALPPMPPREPTLSYEQSCALTEFVPAFGDMSHGGDARAQLVGRWELCGSEALYGSEPHAGIEFGSNGRDQLLRRQNGGLVPVANGPTGEYTLLASGQFMQRGELSLGEYAVFMEFDASLSTLRYTSAAQGEVRYARVAPDLESAAANAFPTLGGGCSMVGVWDTAQDSSNPAAAFAFNEQGEWFGGEWGSDLCAAHSMYGTYQLADRSEGGGDVQPFVVPEFELVTNVGAGRCDFWFGAGFTPRFSDNCNRVELTGTWDNCTGGRGYLGHAEVLSRRQVRGALD